MVKMRVGRVIYSDYSGKVGYHGWFCSARLLSRLLSSHHSPNDGPGRCHIRTWPSTLIFRYQMLNLASLRTSFIESHGGSV